MTPEDEVIKSKFIDKISEAAFKGYESFGYADCQTVQLALEKGIIKSKSIIVDATHTKSRIQSKRLPVKVLQEQSKNCAVASMRLMKQ